MRTLTAYYDLRRGPVSFDFILFLVQALMAAADAGAHRLHVVIVPYADGVGGAFMDKRHLYDAEEMHWRLWNIVIPACRMAGASVTLATGWDQARKLADLIWPPDWDRQDPRRRHHLTKELVAAAKAGRAIPKLGAMEHARRKVRGIIARAGKPLVTITQRKTYEPLRNSDPALWDRVAAELSERFHVVRLLDTDEALGLGAGFGELNLELRLALYQEAAQNIHPHGGPAVLCWFSGAPFLMFGAALPAEFWRKNWIVNVGLEIGEQLPWARWDQRIIYEEASEACVRRELEAWEARLGLGG